jgi:hypothetical protein
VPRAIQAGSGERRGSLAGLERGDLGWRPNPDPLDRGGIDLAVVLAAISILGQSLLMSLGQPRWPALRVVVPMQIYRSSPPPED